jgi:hypothetical protein
LIYPAPDWKIALSASSSTAMAVMFLARIGLLASFAAAAAVTGVATRDYPSDDALAGCPGYKASNVKTNTNGLTASLTLAGPACNVYGTDLTDLMLEVTYENGMFLFILTALVKLHLKIRAILGGATAVEVIRAV